MTDGDASRATPNQQCGGVGEVDDILYSMAFNTPATNVKPLEEEVKKLRKSTNISSIVMIILTIVLIILTAVLVFLTLKLL